MLKYEPDIFWWTLASFGIVLFVLYKYVFPPVLQFLEDREKEQKQLKETMARNLEESQKLRVTYDQKMAGLSDDIKNKWRDVEKELRDLHRRTESELAQERKNAREQLNKELIMAQKAAMHDFSGKIEDVVFSVVGKLFQKKITIKDHEDIIEECIKDAEMTIEKGL